MTHYRQLHTNQDGMISIMVSVILIAVISLIVLGFAQQARREARQTLDRQLSSQAFYAAESGINTAQKVIQEAISSGTVTSALKKDDCANNAAYAAYPSEISTSPKVSYTCLTVNPVPGSLAYSLSATGGSKIAPLEGVNSAGMSVPLGSVKIDWQSTGTVNLANCPTAAGVFPAATAAAWRCGYGVLRIDLVPTGIDGVTNISRDNLMRNTMTAFLVPTRFGTTTMTYGGSGANLYGGSANQGASVATHCDSSQCSMLIRNLGGMPGNYLMRLSSMYRDASVQIRAYVGNSPSSSSLQFKNAQAIIDSTGQAEDVLRRIQVRLPISIYGGLYSDYALQTMNSIDKTSCYYPGNASTSCP